MQNHSRTQIVTHKRELKHTKTSPPLVGSTVRGQHTKNEHKSPKNKQMRPEKGPPRKRKKGPHTRPTAVQRCGGGAAAVAAVAAPSAAGETERLRATGGEVSATVVLFGVAPPITESLHGNVNIFTPV